MGGKGTRKLYFSQKVRWFSPITLELCKMVCLNANRDWQSDYSSNNYLTVCSSRYSPRGLKCPVSIHIIIKSQCDHFYVLLGKNLLKVTWFIFCSSLQSRLHTKLIPTLSWETFRFILFCIWFGVALLEKSPSCACHVFMFLVFVFSLYRTIFSLLDLFIFSIYWEFVIALTHSELLNKFDMMGLYSFL